MHMSDALLSAPVAVGADIVAATLLVVAASKIKKRDDSISVPLMGVMGAFVFAAQMVNFSIPGTGSSGHIIGGILLAAMLGPWAGFLTLASVLIIQCLVFADGGLMALGCNLLNMGAMTTLVAYPLIFRPIAGSNPSAGRIMTASVAASVIGLELGAVLVTAETALSGVTAIPAGKFLLLMTAIHLAIGICEGIATGGVLLFVRKSRPELLSRDQAASSNRSYKNILIGFGIAAIAIAGGLAFLASADPDGLEWSIEKITGTTEPESAASALSQSAADIQNATAVMPDYDSNFAGIAGTVMVLLLVWAVTSAVMASRKARLNKISTEKRK